MELNERIFACMNRVFGIKVANEEISQDNCKEWDSMNHLNLVIELEEDFGISLEPEEIARMRDFESIRNVLKSKC